MSEQMMEEDDDSDFNVIKPTLLQQLKTILDQYPDDGQILKELIQNAEDAGATEVKFLYDKNSYSAEKLHNTSLAKFQGPALYAYNDAQFTKDDWEGIRKIYDSNKVKDPMKVGRFGLGFKSVFHLTGRPITIKPCGKTGDREHPPFTRGLLGLCYEYIGQFFAESMT